MAAAGSSTPKSAISASGCAVCSAVASGIDPPEPMCSTSAAPYASARHAPSNSVAGPPPAEKGYPTASPPKEIRASHGTRERRCASSAERASTGSIPGGTRRLTSARALGCTAAIASSTRGQSMARTVAAGRAHTRSARGAAVETPTPSRTPASRRNSSSV